MLYALGLEKTDKVWAIVRSVLYNILSDGDHMAQDMYLYFVQDTMPFKMFPKHENERLVWKCKSAPPSIHDLGLYTTSRSHYVRRTCQTFYPKGLAGSLSYLWLLPRALQT
jgi:hypothetical protein